MADPETTPTAHCLSTDAVRRILTFLDWRSLGHCAVVCSSWRQLASEDCLWQQHVPQEIHRPSLLSYSAKLEAGWPSALGANSKAISAAKAAACAIVESTATTPGNSNSNSNGSSTAAEASSSGQPAVACSGMLKPLFAAGVLHATGAHQALLARFNTALAHITGWRVVFKARSGTSINNSTQLHTSSPSAASSSNKKAKVEPQCGHPAALTLQALRSSGGWACGCVMMQRQEQSCWVRFKLPPELTADAEVAAAVRSKQLDAVLQGLGPSGWFDVATASAFQLSDDDMEILMQSHKSGFYAWDQRGEAGVDRFDELQPLPWELSAGQLQQQQKTPPTTTQTQQRTLPPAQQQPPPQPQQQHGPAQQPPGAQHGAAASAAQQQPEQPPAEPQLRMLVYVHYEQLLQVLPWALPQTLPRRPHLVPNHPMDLAMHLLNGPCALWLQLDVCQLHGGFKLGTCIVPLKLREWTQSKTDFAAVEEQLLVALYTPSSSINSTEGLGGSGQGEDLAGQQATAGTAGGATLSAAAAAAATTTKGAQGSVAAGLVAGSAAAGSTAAPAAKMPYSSLLAQEACSQVFVHKDLLHGTAPCREDGSVIRTAADALEALMTRDEMMVDFALFDVLGHLLVGRAGVEVWSKEVTDLGLRACADRPSPSSAQQVAGSASTDDSGTTRSRRAADLAGCLGPMPAPRAAVPANPLDMTEDDLTDLYFGAAGLSLVHDELDADYELFTQQQEQQQQVQQGRVRQDFTRPVQQLQFLVDGVPDSTFRSTCITIDARQAPDDWEPMASGGIRSSVSLSLLRQSLRSLFGLAPFYAPPPRPRERPPRMIDRDNLEMVAYFDGRGGFF